MQAVVRSVVVVAVRQVLPLLGGTALASADTVNQVAGAIMVLLSVAYHAYGLHKGQQGPADGQ